MLNVIKLSGELILYATILLLPIISFAFIWEFEIFLIEKNKDNIDELIRIIKYLMSLERSDIYKIRKRREKLKNEKRKNTNHKPVRTSFR